MIRRAIRAAWRRQLWLRFHLFQRRRFNRLVLEHVHGRPFLVLPEVFNPSLYLTSAFMVAALDDRLIPPGGRVLDMGTGSGVGAVFAAQWTAEVTAVDVNPAAVRCARINVLLNAVEDRVNVIHGDLFEALAPDTPPFDVILFNPPFYTGEPSSALDRAFRATGLIERFVAALPAHLRSDGHLLLLLSSDGDEAAILERFRSGGFAPTIAARRDLVSEVVTLYHVTRRERPGDSPVHCSGC